MLLRSTILLAAGAIALGACGSSADPVAAVVEPAITHVEDGLEAIEMAGPLVCTTERRGLETAVEAFELLEGAPPSGEADLVPEWWREESVLFDVVDGAVVPSVGSPCE